ncbi:MAG: hypothetical protein ACOC2D_14975 [Spirochaetota bacterium]
MSALDCSGARYAPYYCEENVYWLAHDDLAVRPDADGGARVVLISNPHRAVAVAAQRAGRGPAGIVVWDYHAVYVRDGFVYDLDSVLSCPVPIAEYCAATFPAALRESAPACAPVFAVIAARDYLRVFSSDRSHMRDEHGSYRQPPPPWRAIFREAMGTTLFALLDGEHEAVASYGEDLCG